jgi:glycosyltransferase involved in cell wall biosynthesis
LCSLIFVATLLMHKSHCNSPLVSVVIPAHNAGVFINKTLNAVISQTYRNLEVLVVDDGSTDDTSRIVESFVKRDHRIILVQQQQSGVAAARNVGIKRSTGEFIAPLDADDVWHPRNIEKQVLCLLDGGPLVGLIYGWSVVIDEDGIFTGDFLAWNIEGYVFQTLLARNFLGNASASLIRRACFDKVGLYDCKFFRGNAQGCEDWDMYLRIAQQYEFRVVPEFLIGYRRVKNSMSHNYERMKKSHSMLMSDIDSACSRIPDIFFRLSKINYYTKFSYENCNSKNYKQARFWLRKSLEVDFILTVISFRSYKIVFKSLVNFIKELLGEKNDNNMNHKQIYLSKSKNCTNLTSHFAIATNRIHLKCVLSIKKLYHRLLQILYERYED